MEQNLEVFFCDLCNTSVPQRDLETGDAARVNEKVVGRCCLAVLRKGGAAQAGGASPASGGVVVGIVLLAAIAGATVFLDWRFGEENMRLAGTITGVQGDLGKQSERLARVEKLASDAAGRGDVDRIVNTFERERGAREETAAAGLDKVLAAAQYKTQQLVEAVAEVAEQQRKSHAAVQGELRALAADVAALKAAPRVESTPPAEAALPAQPAPEPAAPAPTPAADGLPPELAHHAARLGDADAAIRFEAVDKLVQSKNPAVLSSLLKMTKDVDDFVRRLTVEGLASYRHPDTVEALLVALADPINIVRMTAYNSLKTVTGQKIPFDPEGTQTDRLASQRRWQEWWKTARKTF